MLRKEKAKYVEFCRHNGTLTSQNCHAANLAGIDKSQKIKPANISGFTVVTGKAFQS